MTKEELYFELIEHFKTETLTEAAIMLLREVALSDRQMTSLLKENGVSYGFKAVQGWARGGQLRAYKVNHADNKERWYIDKSSAFARIKAEKTLAEQRKHSKET